MNKDFFNEFFHSKQFKNEEFLLEIFLAIVSNVLHIIVFVFFLHCLFISLLFPQFLTFDICTLSCLCTLFIFLLKQHCFLCSLPAIFFLPGVFALSICARKNYHEASFEYFAMFFFFYLYSI